MDSVIYFAFFLAVKMVIAIGDVIEYDDGSVQMSYQKAVLKKGTDSLLIQDPALASLYKDSDSLIMERNKSFFEKDSVEGLTKIGDGYASYLTKKSDGTVRTRIGESELSKYGEGDVDIYHGNSIQLFRNSDIFLIEDGNLGLEKNSDGLVKLYDGKSVFVRKYPDGSVSIFERNSSLEKDANGSVEMHDGISTYIEKGSDGVHKICDSKSFIKKHSDGAVSAGDDYVSLVNDAYGFAEVRDHDLFINKDEHGKQTISDKKWSIARDYTSNSSTSKGMSTIVNDQEGIKVNIFEIAIKDS